mmetsp:Transcript_26412/g.55240  ORF Transcript_26412/g.55240 Transcript_26412/m.55240 type:complete len:204 (+) Transcript_26412:1316-1927(+)
MAQLVVAWVVEHSQPHVQSSPFHAAIATVDIQVSLVCTKSIQNRSIVFRRLLLFRYTICGLLIEPLEFVLLLDAPMRPCEPELRLVQAFGFVAVAAAAAYYRILHQSLVSALVSQTRKAPAWKNPTIPHYWGSQTSHRVQGLLSRTTPHLAQELVSRTTPHLAQVRGFQTKIRMKEPLRKPGQHQMQGLPEPENQIQRTLALA